MARRSAPATPVLDEERVRSISARLTEFAHRDGLPIGAPLTHGLGHYHHQIPGGVISDLRDELAGIRLEHRLVEVVEECVRIRGDRPHVNPDELLHSRTDG